MVDAFGGSGVVALNVPMRSKWYNELNPNTYSYVEALLEHEPKKTHARIQKVIRHFGLSRTNKEGYLQLRTFANKRRDPLLFYVLSRYAFSNLSRFNADGEFTVAFGARSTGPADREYMELSVFYERFSRAKLTNSHYAEVLRLLRDRELLNGKTFIYFDPPYLASGKQTSYAEWSYEEDVRLRRNLDHLTKLGVRWMMSNVFAHKTYKNTELRRWARRYRVIPLKAVYRFSRKTERPPEEVLILNY